MPWWSWMIFGAALLGIEMMSPGGFFVFFFGVAAIIVGALAAVGAGGDAWLQWLLFSVMSVVSLVAFRKRLLERLQTGHASDVGTESLVGEVATLLDDLDPSSVGKAELRGTSWTVRTRDQRRLVRGQRCRVTSVEGLTLWVQAEP